MNITHCTFEHKYIWMLSLLGMMFVMKLEEYQERFRRELDNVVDFWLKYSHDTLHG